MVAEGTGGGERRRERGEETRKGRRTKEYERRKIARLQ
jgi:hypothetical protein